MLPKQLSILGQKIKVTNVIPKNHKGTFSPDNYQGLYFCHEKLIWINNKLPTDEQIKTLLHEIGHVIFIRGGVKFSNSVSDELEEVLVEQFSNTFYDLFLETDFYERAVSELDT